MYKSKINSSQILLFRLGKIKEIAHPPDKIINVNTPMYEVMQIMDSLDTRILPVTGPKNSYLGFVTKHAIFNKYRHILMRQGESIQ